MMTVLPNSPLIPTGGLIAAAFVLFAGIVLTLYFASRADEQPPVTFGEMSRPIVRGAVALAALAAVGLALIWFVLATLVSGTGCVWIIGLGGCLPGR
jgi:hypothetical protein